MNTENMETSITSETISQQTICREIERPNKDQESPDIAKKAPRTSNNDKEIDVNQSKERSTESEQTRKNLNKAKEVYFNLIRSQKRPMVHTKHSAKKRVERM